MKAIVIFDIDGVIRDVGGSYRRAIADTVELFTKSYRPTVSDIDRLKSEGVWNNDWEASGELIYRYFESQGQHRDAINLDYGQIVAFFQSCYQGPDPDNWTGYICGEPLLCTPEYFQELTDNAIAWGFFSGAMRDEALYVLQGKLNLPNIPLIAMEDAPGKPDPTGLLAVVGQLEPPESPKPVIYVGDTVADMYTVTKAQQQDSTRTWVGVGVLPPHIQQTTESIASYTQTLKKAGATQVVHGVQQLTPEVIFRLISE
ncbi:MAG: TIGR01548 family HAD-type hydrolase [Arthrospira sp. SH-MAG29]|nr:TIGR01548 family HAD-type hydrolase [Arthrospira sp. SH-MAG29]MBS0015308.1 TIGR01548 family HAD-type hydrolase [Arthrospira sp. SH-MAG29]